MVGLSIEMLGEERFVRGFSRVSSEIKNFEPLFRLVLDDFREMEARIFDSEGSSEGEGRWQSLSDEYREWKEKNFPGRSIMQLNGYLHAALVSRSTGTVEKINQTQAEFGVDLPYAHRHQMGYKMPMRRIVQVNDTRKKVWGRMGARWANGLIDKYIGTDSGKYNGEESFL